MKKIISIFLIGVLCFYSMSFFIFAEDSVSVYADDEKRSIYFKVYG